MTYIILKFLKPSKETLSDKTSITMQKPIAIKVSYPVYSSLRTIKLKSGPKSLKELIFFHQNTIKMLSSTNQVRVLENYFKT
jgi:hypothetical protein